jgi:prefoldin subunit 5
MRELNNLIKQVESLEIKAMVYRNELCDELRVSMLDAQIKALNAQILELMTLESMLDRFEGILNHTIEG